jgi:hypothetical protein
VFIHTARAADAKGKAAAKKKSAVELLTDDRAMNKQLQWEDKVMGPDSKRAELDKIARGRAITEAASEKAERDKEKQAAAPAPKPKKAEVALPSLPDEKRSKDNDKSHVAISPKLATDEAATPPPPSKPADDKFIDKLLKDEQTSHKKKTSADDKELEHLLAGAKDKPTGRRNRADQVDDLIKSADKGPAMPAPRAQATLPEWTKQPDITSAPAVPPPVAARPQPKANDGVIHVVQGAAITPARVATARPSSSGSSGSSSPRRAATPSAKLVPWNDPFAEGAKKVIASREPDKRDLAPAPKKEAAVRPASNSANGNAGKAGGNAANVGWNDPFADAPEHKTSRRSAAPSNSASGSPASKRGEKSSEPAHGPGWKDPFTKAPVEPARAAVAMREPVRGESSKWEIAARHPASHAASGSEHQSGWSILKKRAR